MVSSATYGLFDPGNVGSLPGRVERVRPGQSNAEILDLRATDDRNAVLLTVSLSVQPTGTPNVLPLQAPFAHLEWGVGSGRDSVDVDFLHGQVLSVAGTFLRITASMPLASHMILLPNGSLGPAPVEWGVTDSRDDQQVLALGASISQMAHAQAAFAATPRLTTFVLVPPAIKEGLSAAIALPNHAQSVTVLAPINITPGTITIAALATRSPTSVMYAAPIFPNIDVDAFPIARGVQFVQLTNASDAAVILPLLWGIGL